MNGTPSVTLLLLKDGVLRPLPAPGQGTVPDHRGRKSRTEAYAIQLRHQQALRELREHEDRYGVGVPLPQLSSRPLQATFSLWRAGAYLAEYITPGTFLLHRKSIRNQTGIDINIQYTPDEVVGSSKARCVV